MSPETEFIQAETLQVCQIVQDECWLEGERRGTQVDPSDEAVQNRVAGIIPSGVGEQFRTRIHPSPLA